MIPFGRYVGSREVRTPADEVLVGREGHRAYFVDLLIGCGRRGAFLVTGRRGAGKTSFVRHCIDEYENAVFKRFLRHNVGLAFWDRVLVLLFIALLLLGALLLSEALQLLTTIAGPGPHRMLLWLILLPIAGALLFPCVYARAVFEVNLTDWASRLSDDKVERGEAGCEPVPAENRRRSSGPNRSAAIAATLGVLGMSAALWLFLPGLSSPAWTGSAMIAVLAALYLGVQALSFEPARQRPRDESRTEAGTFSTWRRWWRGLLVILLGAVTAGTLACSLYDLERLRTVWQLTRLRRFLELATDPTLHALWRAIRELPGPVYPRSGWDFVAGPVFINLAVAGFMLGVGLLLRYGYQDHAAVWSLEGLQPSKSGASGQTLRSEVGYGLRRGAKNYLWPGGLLVILSLGLGVARGFEGELRFFGWLLLVAFGVVVLLLFDFFLTLRQRPAPEEGFVPQACRFRPASRLIMGVSAGISIVLALQLAAPALAAVVNPFLDWFGGVVVNPLRDWFSGFVIWSWLAELGAWLLRFLHFDELFVVLDWAPTLSTAERPRLDVNGVVLGTLFAHRFESMIWLVLGLGVVVLMHFMQYEWVVRPHAGCREGYPTDLEERAPWEDAEVLRSGDDDEPKRWRVHRQMAELTLPWAIYRFLLPTVAVSVNLGLDAKLGSGPVIQAMLVGLRDAYHRIFTSWSAGPANVGRLGALLGLLVLVTLAGDTWFRIPSTRLVERWSQETYEELGPAGIPSGASSCDVLVAMRGVGRVTLPRLVCRLGQGWFDLLYLDLVPPQIRLVSGEPVEHPVLGHIDAGRRLLLNSVLPYRDPESVLCPDGLVVGREDPRFLACRWNELHPAGLHFNVYHGLLFFAFLLVTRSLFRKLPLLPYHQNLRRIDDLLDSLTARTRMTERPSIWEPARWVYSLVADRVRETEREPLDARTVELAFLHILEDIQKGGLRMPGIARRQLNLPAPEITFIFDELDKLGTRLDPEEEHLPNLGAELRALQADQERALRLRGLLSDLKNVLASAPARFIFIGGRNLHDEWLADQTARQPLLTNIFVAEVYLPSLLTDHTHGRSGESVAARGGYRLHDRIEEYVDRQYARSCVLYQDWVLKQFRPSLGLSASSLSTERFATGRKVEKLLDCEVYEVLDGKCPQRSQDAAHPDHANHAAHGKQMVRELIAFLTLRSMGNPKRLKELLASFIRPLAREVDAPDRWRFRCEHVLRLRDDEIFRIQLVSSIYRQLAGAFETRMVRRDDKMATSIFFLSDFLFKFHRRAFSWANLERVDELAHIHRTPDLREIQEEMVEMVSERVLHRVLNGMYSFRFRSDVAREVEYLSRRSAPEMAALNFTLDESQSLKAIYQGSLEQREKRDGPNPGLVAGLGELYEFDQEYETARYYYRRAIDILDQQLCAHTGVATTVRDVLRGSHEGMDDARMFLPWGEARLRLMLQIGMTFEISRSVEHAVTEYRAARTLARALVKAWLDLGPAEPAPPTWALAADQQSTGRHHTLKHLSILFQPIFAEAWASEKITGTVDTSHGLLERGLWLLRELLPFVSVPEVKKSGDATVPPHANLALTLSQLHNKTGDLYFFKGRQPVTWRQLTRLELSGESSATKKDLPTEGYLLRAHYHYAVSLHEIRRYAHHRVESSEKRLSLSGGKTLSPDTLPDFLYQAVARSVNDMAEATLGRVSMFGLLRDLAQGAAGLDPHLSSVGSLEEALQRWLHYSDKETRKAKKDWPLGGWVGCWNKRSDFRDSKQDLLDFGPPDDPAERLLVSVHLCRVGARFFHRGGYLEDAARELLQACWIVSRVLWWFHTVSVCLSWSETPKAATFLQQRLAEVVGPLKTAHFGGGPGVGDRHPFLHHLASLGVHMLEEAGRLFAQSRYRHLRRGDDGEAGHDLQASDQVPSDVLTLACSFGLWLEGCAEAPELVARLKTIAEDCHGGARDMSFDQALHRSLEWQRFPILNRLNGLQILVDHYVLHRAAKAAGCERELARLHVEELLDLNEQYAAPLHFTPHQSGTTCAMYWLTEMRRDGGVGDHRALGDRVFRTAERDLRASEEMCTLRRSFYESISDLYYLYDDFNDRQIHFKHALQMTGAELTTLLRELLRAGRGAPPEAADLPAYPGSGAPPSPPVAHEAPQEGDGGAGEEPEGERVAGSAAA